jgi:DNA invertase Pin-like site-specific DNA recombinase
MNANDSFAFGRSAKILARHLERWAIIYVRQSHPQQVQRHRESAQVQANLQERARQWGWPSERIRVLAGDQGCSGTSTNGRDDFAWLMSEIALGHVGLVLGFQINRLAREDEACCRLIKMCTVFDTLLADHDGVYHPEDINDRMLLTIKGFLGGFELHQLQQRMQAGRLNRCRRGEWIGQTPAGYVVGPTRKLAFDPDEQVQQRIRLIFEQFARVGSVSGVLRYLAQHQLQMPFRPSSGPQRGQLQWHRPHRETLRHLLRHPAYTGAYTWARRTTDPRRAVPGKRGSGRVERPAETCTVFLRDNHPAYLSWEQYQTNLRRLKQQRRHGPVPGPGRKTVSLLTGLVVCGCCGCRMQTRYTHSLRYACQRKALDYAAQPCQSFAGEALEDLVREQVLQVVTPASLELSLRAATECEQQRQSLDQEWRLRLERARHDTDRAFRQYNAVEPENRLVARTLEGVWEKALLTQSALEEEYHRFQQKQPVRLSAAERAQLERLAADLPTLWNSPQTSVADRRQVVRLLLERVVVWASASSQKAKVQMHWTGGTMTEHQIMRRVGTWKQVEDLGGLLAKMRQWQMAGWSSRRIAEELNTTGHRTPRGQAFNAATVRQLLSRAASSRKSARKKRNRSKAH